MSDSCRCGDRRPRWEDGPPHDDLAEDGHRVGAETLRPAILVERDGDPLIGIDQHELDLHLAQPIVGHCGQPVVGEVDGVGLLEQRAEIGQFPDSQEGQTPLIEVDAFGFVQNEVPDVSAELVALTQGLTDWQLDLDFLVHRVRAQEPLEFRVVGLVLVLLLPLVPQ